MHLLSYIISTVALVANIAYASDGIDKHRLDFYVPAGQPRAPIVLFIHGGAFLQGDRRDVAFAGQALANEGLDAAGSVQDVADAAAWLLKNAASYGVQSSGIFLVGHSAGAQIAALLGTDGRYLARAGASLKDIRGVFAVSGVYDLRDLSGEPDSWQRVDGHIYGETPDARAIVSPRLHVGADAAPTVVSCGTLDDPGSCPRTHAFERCLQQAGVESKMIVENGADHVGMLRALVDARDPLNQELLAFVDGHASAAQPEPIDAIMAYQGTWNATITHYKTKYSNPRSETSVVRNNCWRDGGYAACHQIVNGKSGALIVYTYDAPARVYHTHVVPPDGGAPSTGALLIDGNTWTFPWQDKDDGKTVYLRILNVFTDSSTIQFREEFSLDDVHWTRAADGIEHRVMP